MIQRQQGVVILSRSVAEAKNLATDCTSFVAMKQLGITTAYNNKHFDQFGFTRVPDAML